PIPPPPPVTTATWPVRSISVVTRQPLSYLIFYVTHGQGHELATRLRASPGPEEQRRRSRPLDSPHDLRRRAAARRARPPGRRGRHARDQPHPRARGVDRPRTRGLG